MLDLLGPIFILHAARLLLFAPFPHISRPQAGSPPHTDKSSPSLHSLLTSKTSLMARIISKPWIFCRHGVVAQRYEHDELETFRVGSKKVLGDRHIQLDKEIFVGDRRALFRGQFHRSSLVDSNDARNSIHYIYYLTMLLMMV